MSNFGYFSKYLNDYVKQEIKEKMKKEIFKVGDRVYHYTYGWGEVTSHEEDKIITVKFSDDTITFIDGKLLSFTEYTLQGFSQERPIVLPKIGELCLVRDIDNHSWSVRKFAGYIPNAEFPYVTEDDVSYTQMKRIKILD
jgi:hypothetical protein